LCAMFWRQRGRGRINAKYFKEKKLFLEFVISFLSI
jgi:hypothetical protein